MSQLLRYYPSRPRVYESSCRQLNAVTFQDVYCTNRQGASGDAKEPKAAKREGRQRQINHVICAVAESGVTTRKTYQSTHSPVPMVADGRLGSRSLILISSRSEIETSLRGKSPPFPSRFHATSLPTDYALYVVASAVFVRKQRKRAS